MATRGGGRCERCPGVGLTRACAPPTPTPPPHHTPLSIAPAGLTRPTEAYAAYSGLWGLWGAMEAARLLSNAAPPAFFKHPPPPLLRDAAAPQPLRVA